MVYLPTILAIFKPQRSPGSFYRRVQAARAPIKNLLNDGEYHYVYRRCHSHLRV